jgi:predicted ATP-dependent endonuclease of OLD family
MQLIIQNLGSIKQGEIDLTKKFYVLVGYNNTGKTYVSQLLWSIFNEDTIENFSKQVEMKELHFELETKSHFEITPEIVSQILEEFASFLKQKVIPKIFHVDLSHFILKEFSLRFKYDINRIKSCQTISAVILGANVFTFFKEKDSFLVKVTQENVPKDLLDGISNRLQLSSLAPTFYEFLLGLLLNNTSQQPIFLPANRSFYPMFYSDIFRLTKEKEREKGREMKQDLSNLFKELLEKRKNGQEIALESELKLTNSLNNDYTEPMNVLFDKLYRLNENMTAENHYEHLVSEMTKILGGTLIMSKKEGIAPITFGFKPSKHNEHLSLFLSSAAVNQLSTLYLYFKYWAHKENNFLMIDEPEENLHPTNQLALLNILLDFAQVNNNKVLITTHSPLLADAVNNYLYLFWLKSQNVDVNQILEDDYPDINPDINLTTDDIAIYFFDGSRIIPLKRGDYGVLFSDFNASLRKINKISLALTHKMSQLLNDDDEED